MIFSTICGYWNALVNLVLGSPEGTTPGFVKGLIQKIRDYIVSWRVPRNEDIAIKRITDQAHATRDQATDYWRKMALNAEDPALKARYTDNMNNAMSDKTSFLGKDIFGKPTTEHEVVTGDTIKADVTKSTLSNTNNAITATIVIAAAALFITATVVVWKYAKKWYQKRKDQQALGATAVNASSDADYIFLTQGAKGFSAFRRLSESTESELGGAISQFALVKKGNALSSALVKKAVKAASKILADPDFVAYTKKNAPEVLEGVKKISMQLQKEAS